MDKSLFALAANPFQRKRVPKGMWPRLDLPLPRLPAIQEVNKTIGWLILLAFLAGGVVCVTIWGGQQVVILLLFGTYFFYGLGRAIRFKRWSRLLFLFLVLSAGWVSFEFRSQWVVQAVVAICLATAFARSFALHYAAFVSAAPLNKKLADELREKWRAKIDQRAVLACALPITALVVGLLVPQIGVGIIGVVIVSGTGVGYVLRELGSPIRLLRGFVEATVIWFNYNTLGLRLPGMFVSPSGTHTVRMLLTFAAVVAIALPVGIVGGVSGGAFAIAEQQGIITVPPEEHIRPPEYDISPGGELLGDLFLVFGSLGAAIFCVPLALTFAAALFVSSPVLAEGYSASCLAESSETWFYDLTERIQNSDDDLERDSIYWGQVSSDGSPVIIPRSAFEEPSHMLGDSGSGKSALALCPLIEQFILGCVDPKERGEEV